LGLASNVSVAQFIERDDFKNRLAAGRELALHELLYPLMQSYDSVALEADMEFGGTDQLFNLLAARSLQKKLGQKPQIVFISELLVGLDGTKKMSKSLDNYIALSDDPTDMYGKVMSLPDPLIAPYYKLTTDVPEAAITDLVKNLSLGANPRDSKASLAREIVRIYHSEALALKAEDAWNKQFREGGRPTDIPAYTLKSGKGAPGDLFEVLVDAGLAETKSDGRRIMQQGGIRMNGEVWDRAEIADIHTGDILQVGKRRYIEFVVKK
jgi:tyrosyl-tRNA synthetase